MSFNDLESRLRENLGAGSSRPTPSPDFEEHVHLALPPRHGGRHRRAHAIEALAGLAAILAIVAVAGPWLAGPRSGNAPGAPGEGNGSTAGPTAAPLHHAIAWGLTFDYPADWTLVNDAPSVTSLATSNALGNPLALGFVGTGTTKMDCPASSQQGALPTCSTEWSLPEGSIVIRFEQAPTDDPNGWNGYRALDGPEISGATALAIDGLPVRFARSTTGVVPYSSETIPGAAAILWWGVPVQGLDWAGYTIVAAVNGPNAAELEAKAQALIASIHYVNKPTIAPTGAPAIAAQRQTVLLKFLAAVAANADDEHNHAYDCFPRTIGASQPGTITQTLNQSPMTKPLDVICTTVSVEPNAMQGWTIVLKQTWAAGAAYPAGECDATSYTTTDGMWESSAFGPNDKSDPNQGYPNVGPSKYGG